VPDPEPDAAHPDTADLDAADAEAADPDADPTDAAASRNAAESGPGIVAGRAARIAEPSDIGALIDDLMRRKPVLEPLAPPISVGPPPGAAQ
jgi:hypothetical protein